MAASINQKGQSNSFDFVLLEIILEERQRRKKYNCTLPEVERFSCVPNIFWTRLFSKHFIDGKEDECRDDLLFFVKHSTKKNAKVQSDKQEISVFRRQSKRLPSLTDTSVLWEETVYLNIILQQFVYTLTCAVCTRTGPQELQVLKKHSMQVYASPSRRQMDSKGEEEEISYPNIYFMVDNFDEAFQEIRVRDSEMVCVELVASDKNSSESGVIFLGSIRYDALKKVFDRKTESATRMVRRMSFGLYKGNQRMEYVRMRGPYGKGHAEMAVSREKTDRSVSAPVTPTCHTPEHERDFSYTDFEIQEPSPFRDRRMSDPSGPEDVLKNFGKHADMKKAMSKESVNGDVSADDRNEVEAADIRDELEEPNTIYNRMFGRGFGQAWYWLKERRRANSIALNAYLTYVTVPWHTIIEDVLENKQSPILTY